MRINSKESMRRAAIAHARYGSWDAVRKAATLGRDVAAGKTALRVVSRPVIAPENNEIYLLVEPQSGDLKEGGFLYLSRTSCAYNGETYDARGHLITEEIVKKKGLFTAEVVKYQLYVRATNRAKALFREAQNLWDKHQEELASGEVELLVYLPTYGEGQGKRGNSKGSVVVQPRERKR